MVCTHCSKVMLVSVVYEDFAMCRESTTQWVSLVVKNVGVSFTGRERERERETHSEGHGGTGSDLRLPQAPRLRCLSLTQLQRDLHGFLLVPQLHGFTFDPGHRFLQPCPLLGTGRKSRGHRSHGTYPHVNYQCMLIVPSMYVHVGPGVTYTHACMHRHTHTHTHTHTCTHTRTYAHQLIQRERWIYKPTGHSSSH